MANANKRKRSRDHECRICSLCEGEIHHFDVETTEAIAGEEVPEAAIEAAGESGLLYFCRHCPAWMESMDDDDTDTIDVNAAVRGDPRLDRVEPALRLINELRAP